MDFYDNDKNEYSSSKNSKNCNISIGGEDNII